jgi:predicted glycosyltransferase
MARRVLLYSHDTVGLGHIRRVTRIASHLAERDGDSTILILTGSAVADSFRLPANVDVVKLPSFRKAENSRYVPRRLEIGHDRFVALRRELIRGAVEQFEPDVLVVDKVPLGVDGELRPALDALRRRAPHCRVVLSLRDILDSPREVTRSWSRDGIWDALRDFYDDVFVWGMRDVYDVIEAYAVPGDIAPKFSYCGYIAPARPPSTNGRSRFAGKKLVIATVGGGEDGSFLLSQFLRSLPHAEQKFASVVLTGPDLAAERRASLAQLIPSCGRPVFLIDFAAHADRLLSAADVVVSMGGYNTISEIVSRGGRAIVVPRTTPRKEQLIRAERFHELGLLRMIRPEKLTPERLACALDEELLGTTRQPRLALDFGGLDRSADLLESPVTARNGTHSAGART